MLVPCGATLAAACPACAERARSLRAAQCREGWHLEDEPVVQPAPPDDWQAWLLEQRADAQQLRDHALAAGQDIAELDALIGELDDELARTGIRGNPDPGKQAARRHRSTRRRQDAPDLPRRTIDPRTTGKVYTSPDGKRFRPSMFLTLTCDSYGKVGPDGIPADPGSYDYQRAARDALHFAALFDRFIQNLRRFLGYDLQYFAAIEPQRRLAPHVHIAMRGTVSRNELRQVIATTYHQVWWPSTDEVRFDGDRLMDALRYEPCSPGCANWLRYGIQPKDAREGLRPGACKGKAHRREHLGYAGRRVLVSRKWSGKTLADHRGDRKTWLLAMLDLPAADERRYRWEPVTPADEDFMPHSRRLLHVLADRSRWQAALAEARRKAENDTGDHSATGRAA